MLSIDLFNTYNEVLIGVVVALVLILINKVIKFLIFICNKIKLRIKKIRRWYRRKYKHVASGLDQYNIILKISKNEELTEWETKVYEKMIDIKKIN